MTDDDTFEIPPEILAFHARQTAVQKPIVEDFGKRFGFGRLMQLCEEVWGEHAARDGRPGSQHTSGPCASAMVPCPHPESGRATGCEWCAGAGRVTARVSEIARSGYAPSNEA